MLRPRPPRFASALTLATLLLAARPTRACTGPPRVPESPEAKWATYEVIVCARVVRYW